MPSAHRLLEPPALLVLLVAGVAPVGGAVQQGGVVSGSVTTVHEREGVPGARVTLEGVAVAAQTDVDGRFRLSDAPAGSRELRVELVGCVPLATEVDVRATAPVTLTILVDGPALRRDARLRQRADQEGERTFTVERLERSEMERDPARSIADLIRGAFPGVRVVQGSGAPGAGLSIQLRGPSSINAEQAPLLVVDGIITGGGLDDLDPNDVERIEVLKGAAGGALYGARGQAGVIEITSRSAAAAEPRCILRLAPEP
ncbi:MAG: TonB-dependent receptor plug domain-containing protein [Gemmatimonadota bacterium]|nr:TonB-dependent receptor plug domain-containing protein [Gemmatimonadota bacterium]